MQLDFFPSRTLTLYLARLFVVRIVAMLAMLVLVLMVLDLLGSSGKILAVPGNGQDELWTYVGLRVPQLIARFLPYSVLLATVITLIGLNQNSEVIAMKAAGLSAHQVLAPLFLTAAVVSAISFGFNESVVTRANATLKAWEGAEFGPIPAASSVRSNVYLTDGDDILTAATLTGDGERIEMRDVTWYRRRFEDFRRSFLVRVAREYFALVEAQKRLRNQEARVKLLEQITAGETARYEAGRIAEFRRNVAQNNLLSAQASLAGQREQFIVDAEQFKIRLGLPSGTPALIVEQELDLPEPEVGLDRAVALAMEYRLDLQNLRDQLDDRRRGLANARNALLPEADATASVSMPTDPRDRVGGLSFSPGDVNYSAGITFGLPLDREAERVALRQQSIALQRAVREYDRTRDEIAVEVRQSVRRIDLARFQLNIAEQQVEINRRRVLETELKADEVETQFKVDAANALQDAENERDRTRTALRNAVLDYLRQSGQLRVGRDGQFERLPGMGEARPGSTRLSEPPVQPGAVTP
ncbi:LptF/LptG family permease [Leptolyngbya sp. 15MV]|nr:LptF/LptG family permease [Leptolyngbya sp. 15MV]